LGNTGNFRYPTARWGIVFCGYAPLMKQARGFSLTEVLLAMAIVLTISAITLPTLLRSRARATEAAAVMDIRTISTAETIYQISYPKSGYADTLSELGPPRGGAAGPDGADLLAADLACRVQPCLRNGYLYAISGTGTPVTDYSVTATPATAGVRLAYRFNSNDLELAGREIEPKTLQDRH
jgi:prepilin-type N-terminal cleavage/methylation domain-containing protein